MPLYLRPAAPNDELFQYQLAYDTFFEQLQANTWSPEMRDPLLRMQVDGQISSYRAQFPNADYGVIMLDDQRIGRLIVDRGPEVHHLVDITLQRQHRGGGVGTILIRALCTESEMTRKPLRLHVLVTNTRAKALYQRLGFRLIGESPVIWLMERAPGSGTLIATP